jgi:beta-galactosidase
MWSIGNEIPNRRTPRGIDLAHQLSDFIRNLDPLSDNGRAVTSAYPGAKEDTETDAYMAALDVSGYNYGWSHYRPGHARVPARVMAGTESFPMQSFQVRSSRSRAQRDTKSRSEKRDSQNLRPGML